MLGMDVMFLHARECLIQGRARRKRATICYCRTTYVTEVHVCCHLNEEWTLLRDRTPDSALLRQYCPPIRASDDTPPFMSLQVPPPVSTTISTTILISQRHAQCVPHTHTHTHARTHARAHARTHSHTHAHMHAHTPCVDKGNNPVFTHPKP